MLEQLNDLTCIISQLYSTCRVCYRVTKYVHFKVVFSLSPFFSRLWGCLLRAFFFNRFSVAKAAGTPLFSAKLTDVLCSPSRPHLTTIVGVSSHCLHCLPVRTACLSSFIALWLQQSCKVHKMCHVPAFLLLFLQWLQIFSLPMTSISSGDMRVSWGFFVCSKAFEV